MLSNTEAQNTKGSSTTTAADVEKLQEEQKQEEKQEEEKEEEEEELVWQPCCPLPIAKRFLAAVVVEEEENSLGGGSLVVVGGETCKERYRGQDIQDDLRAVEMYSTVTSTSRPHWRRIGYLSDCRDGLVACVLPNRVVSNNNRNHNHPPHHHPRHPHHPLHHMMDPHHDLRNDDNDNDNDNNNDNDTNKTGSKMIENSIYAFGGWDLTEYAVKKDECFTLSTKKCKPIAGMTHRRGGCAGAVVYTGSTETESYGGPYSTANANNNNNNNTAFSSGRRICIVGGRNSGKNLSTIEMFYEPTVNNPGGAWISLPPMQHGVDYCAAAAIGNLFFVVGGEDDRSNTLDQFVALDVTNKTWIPMPPLPTKRSGCAAVSVGRCIVVVGGSDGHKCLDTVELFSLEERQWTTLPSMSTPRYGCAAAVCGSVLYVMGGSSTKSSKDTLRSVECLRLPLTVGTTTSTSSSASSSSKLDVRGHYIRPPALPELPTDFRAQQRDEYLQRWIRETKLRKTEFEARVQTGMDRIHQETHDACARLQDEIRFLQTELAFQVRDGQAKRSRLQYVADDWTRAVNEQLVGAEEMMRLLSQLENTNKNFKTTLTLLSSSTANNQEKTTTDTTTDHEKDDDDDNEKKEKFIHYKDDEEEEEEVDEEEEEYRRNRVKDLICPITLEIMVDPVVAADGHTYERCAIERVIDTAHGVPRSPVTGEDLGTHTLLPNYLVRRQCREHADLQQQQKQQKQQKQASSTTAATASKK